MEFGLREVLYILGFACSALVAFFGTRHKLKEYIRDRNDELKDQIQELKMQLKDQKNRDDLQQQVIDQIGKQMDLLIPKLIEELRHKRDSDE